MKSKNFFQKNIVKSEVIATFANANGSETSFNAHVFVAQLVEQLTLNQWVQGSSPCEDTTSKPQIAEHATLAQLVERRIRNA